MIAPVDYRAIKKSTQDVVIECKKEQIDAMSKTIRLLHHEMQNHGLMVVDLTEDEIFESVEILLEAVDEDVSGLAYFSHS